MKELTAEDKAWFNAKLRESVEAWVETRRKEFEPLFQEAVKKEPELENAKEKIFKLWRSLPKNARQIFFK